MKMAHIDQEIGRFVHLSLHQWAWKGSKSNASVLEPSVLCSVPASPKMHYKSGSWTWKRALSTSRSSWVLKSRPISSPTRRLQRLVIQHFILAYLPGLIWLIISRVSWFTILPNTITPDIWRNARWSCRTTRSMQTIHNSHVAPTLWCVLKNPPISSIASKVQRS